ncbi:MAG: adenylyltransferase/cytidyltransferase family protein [Cyclobacteriaceae bacterium]|nr:adenylyltransferase/cytidyltransferase family protein [Cyclobacteriaceae bacterium]
MLENIKAKVLAKNQLQELRHKNSNKKIVFATGCYDILQSGHAVFFNQCKSYGDILIVGVGKDETLRQLKGPGRPVNPENNRIYLVAAMEDVNYAVLNDDEIGEGKIDFKNVLDELRPDIFIVNDDDSSIAPKQALCDNLGIKIEFVTREVPEELMPTSTSNIINKINYSLKAPLRIDFAGGWADVPYIMDGKKGYVSNVAIRPLVEYKGGKFNFSGYPRGSGLSTSTAAKLLEMLNSKTYNAEPKSLANIGEDLFNLENQELQWFIGRQDQYGIVYGGFHCFEFGDDYAKPLDMDISHETLEKFRSKLLLLHTSESRNAQVAVEEVYKNHKSANGQKAISELVTCGYEFARTLEKEDFDKCALIIERNWNAQKLLAPSSTTPKLDQMYSYAKENGALGGKLCGAGGGGAFLFYSHDVDKLKKAMKHRFVDAFEIDFEFEYRNVKELNQL